MQGAIKIFLFIIFIQFVHSIPADAQKGACKPLDTDEVKVAKYLGRWYEIGTSGLKFCN